MHWWVVAVHNAAEQQRQRDGSCWKWIILMTLIFRIWSQVVASFVVALKAYSLLSLSSLSASTYVIDVFFQSFAHHWMPSKISIMIMMLLCKVDFFANLFFLLPIIPNKKSVPVHLKVRVRLILADCTRSDSQLWYWVDPFWMNDVKCSMNNRKIPQKDHHN